MGFLFDTIPFKNDLQFMVKIKFYSLIRMHLGINEIELEIKDITIYELLKKAEIKLKQKFIDQLIDDKKQVLPGTLLLIDGRNIVHLKGINSMVEDSSLISIFPPGGGG